MFFLFLNVQSLWDLVGQINLVKLCWHITWEVHGFFFLYPESNGGLYLYNGGLFYIAIKDLSSNCTQSLCFLAAVLDSIAKELCMSGWFLLDQGLAKL